MSQVRKDTGTANSISARSKFMPDYLTREVTVEGKAVRLYSTDGGRTWSTSQEDLCAWEHRKTQELKKFHHGNKPLETELGWPPLASQE